ncbi:MAG: hypothetical protein HZB53_05360 [Chloroflexi bacterium]|nr:hypothetical protein [Chloroflexota bacterium]
MNTPDRDTPFGIARLLSAYDRAVMTQFANARVLLPIGLFALFTLAVFPALRAWAGPAALAVVLPDTRWSWTAAEGYAALDALGDDGRRLYALSVAVVDMLYPLVSALMLGALIALAWGAARPGRWDRRLARLPLVYLLADYSENAGLVVMLANYPARMAGIAQTTAAFTTLKWALVGLCAVVILAGTAAAVFRRLTNRGLS